MDKAALRQQLRALRRAIPSEQRADLHRRIGAHLAELLAPLTGPIALYAPQPSEASPLEVLPQLHQPIAWPRVAGTAPPRLTFHLAPFHALRRGAFALREPPEGLPEVALGDLAALVVPGLAFDAALNRLGQGGGFYDAALAAKRTRPERLFVIGLAYACQRVASLPREPHDRPVDVLVTEDGAHWPPPAD